MRLTNVTSPAYLDNSNKNNDTNIFSKPKWAYNGFDTINLVEMWVIRKGKADEPVQKKKKKIVCIGHT